MDKGFDIEGDRLVVKIDADLGPLAKSLQGLAAPIEKAMRPIQRAMDLMHEGMEEVVDGLTAGLTRAVETGELNFRDMIRAIIADLQAIAIERFVATPIQSMLGAIIGRIFGGARALGGPVAPNRAYLVGERGPELFVPSTAGHVDPGGRAGAPVIVNIHTPDIDGFRRSQGQVAASLSRAVARGRRNL